MKIVDYHVSHSCNVSSLIKDGWHPFGTPYFDSDGQGWQAVVKYEKTPSLEMSSFDSDRITNCLLTGVNNGSVELPYPCSEMCMIHAPELRHAHERANKLTYENDDLMRENEQLKEKILFYESPLSEGELTYDELIKKNKRLETIIEILVSNHCQELVSGETVMYFSGNLIKENGDSFEDDIYNIARKIIEKK